MRQTVTVRLSGALAAAVAVEWTDRAAPVDSADGWQACQRLANGDWRFASHTAGAGAEWRAPGLFANVALRYRLTPAGPWSPISAGRKEITLVVPADPRPAPLAAADWSGPVPVEVAGGFTGHVVLTRAAVAVEWCADGVADWQACVPVGDGVAGAWRLASYGTSLAAGTAHLLARGGRLTGVVLRVRAVEGGPWSDASDRRTLDVPAEDWVPPFLILAPVLAGTGKVGATVTASPGTWGGFPAPSTSLQWCRDGVPIEGATGSAYVPSAADDRRALTCRVTAASIAGSVGVVTASLAITQVAPAPEGTIPEEILDEDTGPFLLDVRPFFRGEGLGFGVTGAGASVDAAGLVSIPTDVPLSDTVRVVATNSGGSATQAFQVTVEAGTEIVDPPAALTAADWDVYWDVDPTQDGVKATWHFAVKAGPALGATRFFWRGQATADGAKPGEGFNACLPHPSKAGHWIARAGTGTVKDWLWVNSANAAYNVVGQKMSHIAIYTCDSLAVAADAAVYAPVSNVVEKVVKLEGGKVPEPVTATRRMPIVFPSEMNVAGYVPADAMQQWHALDWCLGDPDVIYGMQDTGGVWLSRNHGASWYLPTRAGLNSFQGLGVAVDPVDPLRVLCNMGGSYNSTQPYQGLYASTDGAMSFGPRIAAGVTDSRRGTHSALAYAPSSIGARRAEKWLAIVDGRFEDGNASVPIMASTDGWEKWTQRGTWNQASFGTSSWMVGDGSSEGRFYVACGQGLVRITNAFSGTLAFTRLSGSGGLPAGGVAGKPYVSADGKTIIVGTGSGIYRTVNGGTSWARVGSESDFAKLAVNPYNPDHMVLIYDQQSSQQRPKFSVDGGVTFTSAGAADIERRPGMSYTPAMMYNFAHAAFHSTPGNVWLCGRQTSLPQAANHYRSTDYGKSWKLSTEGFNGSNFGNRGVSPFMFSPTDRNRFALSMLDSAIWLTTNGGRSFAQSTYTNEMTGQAKRTAFGVSLHPDAARKTIFGAVGTGSSYVMVRSLDDGATWDLPLGTGTTSDGNLIAFDLDDPSNVFWGRHRNTSHGAGAWTLMSGLSADYAVWGCTLNAPKMAKGQALFALDLDATVSKVRRSLDRGVTWTDVLAMPYDNRSASSKYGPFRAHPSDPDILFTIGPERHIIRKWSLASGTAASRPYVDLNVFGAGKRPSGMSTEFEASYMAIDPRYPDVMYVLTTHAGSPRLYRTTDGGASAWTPLPDVFPLVCNANAIEVSPVTGDVVMGGSNGTFIAPPPYPQAVTVFGALSQGSYLQTTAW